MFRKIRNWLWAERAYISLALGCLVFCGIFVLQYGVFGADVDWVSQHSVLPEYFRQRFYATKEIFPDMAWNLGGGQNIYNFSYYGLFSPLFLPAYVLPFVAMDHYLMGVGIVTYVASVLLFYYWMGEKSCSEVLRFGSAWMFALATPLIFHSYNHVMFVNYMPFLCLALIGTDRYLKDRKKSLLLAGTIGMILTSYFFSIGGIVCICAYGLWKILQEDTELCGKRAGLRTLMELIGYILLSITCCGILLIPSALAILQNGRSGDGGNAIRQFFAVVPDRFLYNPYGIGLASLTVIALLSLAVFGKSWKERLVPILLILLFTSQIAAALLNGGLYARNKVFIPFLPLLVLLTVCYLEMIGQWSGQGKKRVRWMDGTLYVLWAILIFTGKGSEDFSHYWVLAELELLVLLLMYKIYLQHPKVPWPLIWSCAALFMTGWYLNWYNHTMIAYDTHERDQEQTVWERQAVEQTLDGSEEDPVLFRMERIGNGRENRNHMNEMLDIRQNLTSIYSSVYQERYREFETDIFQLNEPLRNRMMQAPSSNPIWLSFMGVRYVLSEQSVDGYRIIGTYGNMKMQQNERTAPVIYGTSEVMGEEAYRKLQFPETQTLLLQRAVVPENHMEKPMNQDSEEVTLSEYSLELPEVETETVKIRKTADGYLVNATENTTVDVALQGWKKENDLLAVSMEIENLHPASDMHIRLQKQSNRLSSVSAIYANANTDFHYVVSVKQEKVTMEFSAGVYRIHDLSAYCGQFDRLRNPDLYAACLKRSGGQPKDTIEGTLDMKTDGYLITSIPYDENFTLLVDGVKTGIFPVNTSFLGSRIPEGKHEIELRYRAPGKRAGLLLSGLGCLGMIGIRWREKAGGKKRTAEKNSRPGR